MDYIILAYCIYLPLAVALTVWVARTLYTNGKIFLVDIFHGQDELAASVNRLLQTGFYLISLGYAIIKLKIYTVYTYDQYAGRDVADTVSNMQDVMETLSAKLGGFILILGLMLFFNLFMLLILRSGAKSSRQPRSTFVPPVDLLGKA